MKEYGSNVQKLVGHLVSITDRDQRTKHAHILVELMRQIHPQMRDGADYSKKLWDDLYIMADFDLDVDSPYPPPPKEILGKKPQKIPYSQNKLKTKVYGRNIELMVLRAMLTPGAEERKVFVSYLVKLMKSFYMAWNKDMLDTKICINQILELSGGKLKPEIDDLVANGVLEDLDPKEFKPRYHSHANNRYENRGNNKNGGFKYYKKNNNNGNNNNRFSNNNNNNNNNRNRRPNNN
jgi:hypothetical protein